MRRGKNEIEPDIELYFMFHMYWENKKGHRS